MSYRKLVNNLRKQKEHIAIEIELAYIHGMNNPLSTQAEIDEYINTRTGVDLLKSSKSMGKALKDMGMMKII